MMMIDCMSPEEMVEEDYIKMQWFELREIDEILSTSWPKQQKRGVIKRVG